MSSAEPAASAPPGMPGPPGMLGSPDLPGPPGLLGFRRVLIVTAVEVERAAVVHGVGAAAVVVAGGVGPADAAAATARCLTRAECDGQPFDAVLSAGIGGGFTGRAAVGDLVLGDLSVAADLGAADGSAFVDIESLGFGRGRYPADALLLQRLRAALSAAVVGPVLTVSTATGSATHTDELRRRVPAAAAEAMEGFGVAVAAAAATTPFAELRAISNAVGPRDRSAWRIPQALDALRATFAALAAAPGTGRPPGV